MIQTILIVLVALLLTQLSVAQVDVRGKLSVGPVKFELGYRDASDTITGSLVVVNNDVASHSMTFGSTSGIIRFNMDRLVALPIAISMKPDFVTFNIPPRTNHVSGDTIIVNDEGVIRHIPINWLAYSIRGGLEVTPSTIVIPNAEQGDTVMFSINVHNTYAKDIVVSGPVSDDVPLSVNDFDGQISASSQRTIMGYYIAPFGRKEIKLRIISGPDTVVATVIQRRGELKDNMRIKVSDDKIYVSGNGQNGRSGYATITNTGSESFTVEFLGLEGQDYERYRLAATSLPATLPPNAELKIWIELPEVFDDTIRTANVWLLGSFADSVRYECIIPVLNSVATTAEHEESSSGFSQIAVAPNPASDVLRIISRNATPTHVEIVDLAGRVVYENSGLPKDKPVEISVKEWGQGVYFVINRTTRQSAPVKIHIVR